MLTGHQKPSLPGRARQPKSRHRQEGLGIGPLAPEVLLVPQFQNPSAWAPLCLCSCFLSFKCSRRGSSAFVPFAFPPCSVFPFPFLSSICLSSLFCFSVETRRREAAGAVGPSCLSSESCLAGGTWGETLRWPVPRGPLISNVLLRAICPAQSLWCKLCVLWLGWGGKVVSREPSSALGLAAGVTAETRASAAWANPASPPRFHF